MKYFFLTVILMFGLASCARVGSPVGGQKDTIAPRFLGTNIDTTRTGVSTSMKHLRLDFDEYVTLKDISKNLIIAPPIKVKKILPTSLANKYILIEWDEPLKDSTTYSFNFGNAIVDYNEGNVLPYFNFAFSTGNQLDDTYLSGEVFDGLQLKTDPNAVTSANSKQNIVVGLYQERDTIDYLKKPYYITKADPDGYFELNYLSKGKYRILAFDDENQNSIFDAGKEKVGFLKEPLEIDSSISKLPMGIFPSRKKLKYKETKDESGVVTMLFEGNPTKVEIESSSDKLKNYKVLHRPKSDTVQIWFDAVAQEIGVKQSENLKFHYTADSISGDASVFYRQPTKSELSLGNRIGAKIPPQKNFEIVANFPLDHLQPEKWTLKSDSLTTHEFSAQISELNPLKIEVKANFEIGKKYTLTIPKESVASYYKTLEKSYQFNFEIDKEENFGSFVLNIENKPEGKFWVQFLNEKYEVVFQKYTDANEIKFGQIKPNKYLLRILVDNNGNEFWDSADLASLTFAEEAYLFPKTIEIRPLWENREQWNLKSNDTLTQPATLTPEVEAIEIVEE